MVDFSNEILAIKQAIASGATRVSYGDKTVDYDSFEKMLARLAWLEAQQNGGTQSRPMAAYASFDRGD